MRHLLVRQLPLLFLAPAAAGQAARPAGPPPAPAPAWSVDRNHSQVGFVVRHFFTPVRGKFDSVDVALEFDPDDPAASSVAVTIPVAGVNTGNERRDNDLRSPNFFDAAAYPTISFRSSAVRVTGPDAFVAVGTLTIKDVSKEVELPIRFLGRQDVPARNGGVRQVAGFEAELTLDRLEFGVGTGDWVRTNVVAGDVKVEIAIEASRRLADAPAGR